MLAYISERARTRNHMQEKQDRIETDDQTQGIPDWLHDFTAIPEEVNSDSEGSAKVFDKSRFRKHSILLIFQRTDIATYALRTTNTRSPCRRLHEGTIPRAEIFGDSITADHKVLIGEGVSRNNHRYAVVVQDLATQWIQSFPCKTKTSQETEKSLRKLLEPSQKLKVNYTDNSLEFGESCEEYHGIIELPHLIDQKQMGLQTELYDE